jgi:hypothetical protein
MPERGETIEPQNKRDNSREFRTQNNGVLLLRYSRMHEMGLTTSR